MKNKSTRILLPSYSYLIYAFFYLPIAILIFYSFNNSRYSLMWHGATLNWYHSLFANDDIWIAAGHSVIIGILSSSIATMLGTLGAFSLYRYRFLGKQLLHGLIFILIVTPDIVTGISLLVLFSTFKMTLGFQTLLIAHITFCLPFVVVLVYSRLVGLDRNIFEAAKDLGANDIMIFRRVTLPLLWPAMLSAWLLSFTLSFDDILISFFVSGPDFDILPLEIYGMVRHGIKPEINALCTITFCLTLLLVIIAQWLMRKKHD